MPYSTLISVAQLQATLSNASLPPTVLLDCGFDLADTSAGQRAYAAGHLPGALYAHLDDDLAGPKTGRNGRHPLPERAAWAARAGRWGITPAVQVVVYDNQGGIYAARAWWLLRWLGHQAVAVLDGGTAAWLAAGGALSSAASWVPAQPPYPAGPPAMPTVDAATLLADIVSAAPALAVVDARAAERFRGDVEALDPVAGHLPGALNRFFKNNLQADGRFKTADQLRLEFTALLPNVQTVVHSCGSGVTACHNLLAVAHAGLGDTALYPGSWSEWCADPARPTERG
jgi:thiosulfate/3-mercaptopyruvate sulfurtransferase